MPAGNLGGKYAKYDHAALKSTDQLIVSMIHNGLYQDIEYDSG